MSYYKRVIMRRDNLEEQLNEYKGLVVAILPGDPNIIDVLGNKADRNSVEVIVKRERVPLWVITHIAEWLEEHKGRPKITVLKRNFENNVLSPEKLIAGFDYTEPVRLTIREIGQWEEEFNGNKKFAQGLEWEMDFLLDRGRVAP